MRCHIMPEVCVSVDYLGNHRRRPYARSHLAHKDKRPGDSEGHRVW